MKIYPNLNVNVVIQDCGKSWLIVMEGAQPDCELMFNAFYNFGATNEHSFTWDDVRELGGSFYSNPAHMVKFFEGFLENRYYNVCKDQEQAEAWAKLDAPDFVEHLYHTRQSRPVQIRTTKYSGVYQFGNNKCESPDDSFVDAVVRDANKIGMAAQDKVPTNENESLVSSEIREMFVNL